MLFLHGTKTGQAWVLRGISEGARGATIIINPYAVDAVWSCGTSMIHERGATNMLTSSLCSFFFFLHWDVYLRSSNKKPFTASVFNSIAGIFSLMIFMASTKRSLSENLFGKISPTRFYFIYLQTLSATLLGKDTRVMFIIAYRTSGIAQ